MRPVLDDAEVRQLADLAVQDRASLRRAARHRVGVDAEGHVWMLQSRPVTSTGTRRGIGRSSDASAAARPRRSSRPRRGTGQRKRPVRVIPVTRRRGPSSRRRRAGDAHDLAGLGAADAARRGDRHRLWRDDLPCRDRVPRAWRAVRRWHREATSKLRDAELVTVDATHGVVLRGRPQPPLRRRARPPPRRAALVRASRPPARSCL